MMKLTIFKTVINFNTGDKTKQKINLIGFFDYDKNNFTSNNITIYIFNKVPTMRRMECNKGFFDTPIYSFN